MQKALSLFLFRRDLRLEDNKALTQALLQSQRVLCAFIFDPRQTNFHPYFSQRGFQFLVESLNELAQSLERAGGRLYFFSGTAEEVVERIMTSHPLQALYLNRDYTPFSKMRDQKLEKLCASKNIDFLSFDDSLLNPPELILKGDGSPYSVFTPFFTKARQIPVAPPISLPQGNFFAQPLAQSIPLPKLSLAPQAKGGRRAALEILKQLNPQYEKQRDYPSLDATTHLSPHLKFNTVSVREVYHAVYQNLGAHHPLLRQLYWRDFFTHIAFHFPKVFGKPFHEKYSRIKWSENKTHFEKWKNGETGFPIVDAGMRELNSTGFMHNRVRMITASFLVKDLLIDWRWGEQYFAQTLMDYDPAVNNGNWQWVASTGCDATPYFRIFNPWLQQAKFDPEAIYIKKWVPELQSAPPSLIHKIDQYPLHGLKYPQPFINHAQASTRVKTTYKNVL